MKMVRLDVPVFYNLEDGVSTFVQIGKGNQIEVVYKCIDNIIISVNTSKIEGNIRLVLPVFASGVCIDQGAIKGVKKATIINLNDEVYFDRAFAEDGSVFNVINASSEAELLSKEVLIPGNIDKYECGKYFYVGSKLVPNSSVVEDDGTIVKVYGKVKDGDSFNMQSRGEAPSNTIRIKVDSERIVQYDGVSHQIKIVENSSVMV